MCKLGELRSLTAQAVWRRYQRMYPRLTVTKKKKISYVIHKINLWGEVKKFGKQYIPHNICQQGAACHILWVSFTCAMSLSFFSFSFWSSSQTERARPELCIILKETSIDILFLNRSTACAACGRYFCILCALPRGQDSCALWMSCAAGLQMSSPNLIF